VIGADGRLRGLESAREGNPSYDQVALRAVNDANPFPAAAAGFGKQTLKVGPPFVHDRAPVKCETPADRAANRGSSPLGPAPWWTTPRSLGKAWTFT